MNYWMFLFIWIGSQTMHLAFAVLAVRQPPDVSGPKRLGSLVVSGLASIFPLITLLLFLGVFVIGGSSNVAQLAGESGHSLWGLWAGAWPLLFLANPVALLVNLVVVFLPPYPPSYWKSFTSRVCAVVAAGFAWNAVIIFFRMPEGAGPRRGRELKHPTPFARGAVREGAFADLVLFDRATYDDPQQLSAGIEHVIVNGVPIIAGGGVAENAGPEQPGRALRFKA